MGDDILSDVLRNVRLHGALFYFVDAGRGWVAEAPPSRDIAADVMPGSEHVMEYHVVTQGQCWAAIVGENPVRLHAGDVVLFPHGDAHVLSSAPGMRAPVTARDYVPAGEPPFTLRVEGGQPAAADDDGARLVCGFLGCDLRPFNPLIGALPRLLRRWPDIARPP